MSMTVADTRMAIIMCHPSIPDDEDARLRLDWLRRFVPNHQIIEWSRSELDMKASWNLAMQEVLNAPSHIQECLFIHDDVIPDERSDLIWDRDDDVVCCRFDADAPWIWSNRQAFHNAMFRVKRKVIEIIPAPWWDELKHWDAKADTTVGCICNYFSKQAQSYLFSVANTGECKHLNLRKWGKMPKAWSKGQPPKNFDKETWDMKMKYFRKRKADRLKEIRNGK